MYHCKRSLRGSCRSISLSKEYMILLRNVMEWGGICGLSNISHYHQQWKYCDVYHTFTIHLHYLLFFRDLHYDCLATLATLVSPARVKIPPVSEKSFIFQWEIVLKWVIFPTQEMLQDIWWFCFALKDFAYSIRTFRLWPSSVVYLGVLISAYW